MKKETIQTRKRKPKGMIVTRVAAHAVSRAGSAVDSMSSRILTTTTSAVTGPMIKPGPGFG